MTDIPVMKVNLYYQLVFGTSEGELFTESLDCFMVFESHF